MSDAPWQVLIAGRRSIRRYRPEPVPSELVDRLVAAAGCAPSAHHRQPWRFAVLDAPPAKERLARAMAERLRRDRAGDGDDAAAIERDAARSEARITAAPIVIVLCLTMADMDRYGDARRARAEYLMTVQSTAMAAQSLLLAAHGAGLGACWMCAPLFCPDTVAAALALPPGWEPQALITLGWPAEPGRDRPRRGPDELVWRPPS